MVIEEVEGDTDEEEEEDCQSIEVEQDRSTEKSINEKPEDGKKDSSDEDRKKIKMNADASDKPLVNGNISKNESKNIEEIQKEKHDILQSGLQKLAKNSENEGQCNKESKSGDKLSNEGDKNVQSQGTNVSHVISENEQNDKLRNQNSDVVQSEGKNSVLEAKDNEQNEQIEKMKESSDRQSTEMVSSESVEEKDNEALRRPVFIQKKLPDNVSVLREEGNNLFRTGQYGEAVKKYSTAIDRLQKCKFFLVKSVKLRGKSH